jgi:hypothetical protein
MFAGAARHDSITGRGTGARRKVSGAPAAAGDAGGAAVGGFSGEAKAPNSMGGRDQGSRRCCGAGGDSCTASIVMKSGSTLCLMAARVAEGSLACSK